jgi:hypothetical protein
VEFGEHTEVDWLYANKSLADAMALDVIIEECDSRFDENQQQAILDAVGDVLGHDDEADGDGDGADVENAGGDMSVDA